MHHPVRKSVAFEKSTVKVRERCVSLAWKARWLTRARPLDKVGGSPPQGKAKSQCKRKALQWCYIAGSLRRGRVWEKPVRCTATAVALRVAARQR
eukprot:6175939-Pleurochrysis_carterae.AAC.1